MSWFSNYLFGEYSDESVVPDSYEGAAISDSYEKNVQFNMREEEVVSGIRDNTVQLDLNVPVEDSYGVQPDFYVPVQDSYVPVQDSYGVQLDLNVPVEDSYGVQPDLRVPVEDLYGVQLDLNVPVDDVYTPQFENPYGQPNYQDHGYGVEESNVQEEYGYDGDQGDGDEQEDSLLDKDGCYPVTFSFDQTVKFSSRDELVDWVQNTGKANGYVIVIRRSIKRGSNFRVWFKCSLGGDYKSVATVRKTGSKKIGCPFQMVGFSELSGRVWKMEVTEPRHNHTPIENLEGHAYARRLSSEDTRLVEQMKE